MEDGGDIRTVKERIGKFLDNVGKNYTNKQVSIVLFLAAALVLILFLITRLGNQIINILGYVVFIGGVIYGAYRLYKRIIEGGKPVGKHVKKKPRKGEEQMEMEEVTNMDSDE